MCFGKDDAVSTSASGALETPKRTPKAEGGGASAGKVAAALAPPAAVASQSTVAISSPSKSPSKQLNLDSLDIKVTKDVVQKHKSAKEARGGGASGYKLTVNLSGVVTTSGRAKVVGVVNLVDRRNAPCWILKPDVLIDTLQALTENPHLACLSDLAKSAKERFLCATFLAVLMLGSCPAPRLGQLFQSQPPCFPWTCQRRFALLPRRLFAWCKCCTKL